MGGGGGQGGRGGGIKLDEPGRHKLKTGVWTMIYSIMHMCVYQILLQLATYI